MQFTIVINQVRMLEWGLNLQQACLFSFLSQVPSWASTVEGVGGRCLWRITKKKVMTELPTLTDKPDTVYRYLRELEKKFGLIEVERVEGDLAIRITKKGSLWNRTDDSTSPDSNPPVVGVPCSKPEKNPSVKSDQGGYVDDSENFPSSEKNPSVEPFFARDSEKNPNKLGKKSELTSENFPTYQYTNNQNTKINSAEENARASPQNFSTIPRDWQPSSDLVAMVRQANPGVTDAEIAEVRNRFVVYWLERGEKRRSWGAVFMQRFKRDLVLIRQQSQGLLTRDIPLSDRLQDRSWAGRSTRDVSLAESLSDRSWADGGDYVGH
mgnify:CR=1 FL=1